MDQQIRNKLRNVVTQCRKLLEESITQALQGQFGIYAGQRNEVHIEEESRMTHLSEEEQSYRRDILGHFEHIKALGYKPKDTLDQLIREIAFTHLNRLCAYKMMEARQVYVAGRKFREAVSRGIKSNGFMFYLADHPEDEKLYNTGKQDVAYRHFLDWLGGLLSEEIGVLFSTSDPANRLYPPQRVLDEVLALINSEDLVELWSEDETIGWVYQYFTPKEMRERARKESSAPRNSYELAFRNQFFTPLYVVEFLTDNTLGRIWYEMSKGETKLKEQCGYMVSRPREIFLQKGQTPPEDIKQRQDDLSEEEVLKLPFYVPHRPKKDPREIKILDPACGSGHFLLYCFDLLWTIYEEAYQDPDLGPSLSTDYPTLDELHRNIPSLILGHNLHGIDIDLRATQIAALALWLRCQRAYQELNLKKERPKITRSNIVCAEPMPGEKEMLKEFVGNLSPKVLSQLVEVVFNSMELAGEAGSLLNVEKQLRGAVTEAKKQWLKSPKQEQLTLFEVTKRETEQQLSFDLSGITDEQFWDEAEAKVMATLREFATKSTNDKKLYRQLFANDTIQGFSFIDLCRNRFDVVLMNPPFGEPTKAVKASKEVSFPDQPTDLYCWFVAQAFQFLRPQGLIGCITSSSFKTYNFYERFRIAFISTPRICSFVDLGWEVLDEAYVEACCYTMRSSEGIRTAVPFFDIRNEKNKGECLADMMSDLNSPNIYWRVPSDFRILESSPIIYEWDKAVLKSLAAFPTIGSLCSEIGIGAGPHSFFYRLRWEVPLSGIGLGKRWAPLVNGGPFSPFRREDYLVLDWEDSGHEIKEYLCQKYPYLKGNTGWKIQLEAYYGKSGITYGKKTTNFSAQTLPKGCIFSFEGIGMFPKDSGSRLWLLSYLNSSFASWFLNSTCGLHKNPIYLKRLPVPNFSADDRKNFEELAQAGWTRHFFEASYDETSSCFLFPTRTFEKFGLPNQRGSEPLTLKSVDDLLNGIDQVVWKYIPITPVSRISTSEEMDQTEEEDLRTDQRNSSEFASNLLGYLIGCVFGRWDIRYATGEVEPPVISGMFGSLPVCAPGMLQASDGLPVTETPLEYPLAISWDGILVDDAEHEYDIVRQVRGVLELLDERRAEIMEKQTCDILGVQDLRDYFSKPGKGGFWDDHVKRYTKSRRKAPIYWLMQSSKKKYALWVYYHRLDKDTLFKALVNYVEPKIRIEESRLESLRTQRAAAGSSGKAVKKLEREVDRQEEVLSELRDFEDKLKKVANLHLKPDLNDGVVLNIAPLYELIPWKDAKKYWEELLEGKYEWSSMGKQLRDKGLVRAS